MILLITYVLVALGFSFLCSIAEAVLLSITNAHVALLEREEKKSGFLLRQLKDEVNKPLAAILTLNTIAHTMGAAGAGAQAAVVFGSASIGIFSAILTFLILVFSEIIPKTVGAHYWRELAPATAYGLHYLIYLLYPFVKLSEFLTRGLTSEPTLSGFSREEFAVMAELSAQEGQLGKHESQILKNLMLFRDTPIKSAMTPRTVLFSLSETLRVEEFFHKYDDMRFSRIPIYEDDPVNVTGFVLRSDLLLAQARGNTDNILKNYARSIPSLLATMKLSQAFNEFLRMRAHIILVVNEHGSAQGVLTFEDLIETLLGLEIVDESDKDIDMQKLARRLWKKRAKEMGLDLSQYENSE
ncbi:CNNM domain-containing protein [Algicola sagamiensis]|uniref:CNNM domain-containing protein n=1 Tax=Algicola sagamiensis TaxID=163869 RepID=UPI0003646209|nr:hemolysin family protein [Algicola sagamiensis]